MGHDCWNCFCFFVNEKVCKTSRDSRGVDFNATTYMMRLDTIPINISQWLELIEIKVHIPNIGGKEVSEMLGIC